MIDDSIEDVYDAVRWLREHGIEVNDNTNKEGGSNYAKIKVKPEMDNSKRYRQYKNASDD